MVIQWGMLEECFGKHGTFFASLWSETQKGECLSMGGSPKALYLLCLTRRTDLKSQMNRLVGRLPSQKVLRRECSEPPFQLYCKYSEVFLWIFLFTSAWDAQTVIRRFDVLESNSLKQVSRNQGKGLVPQSSWHGLVCVQNLRFIGWFPLRNCLEWAGESAHRAAEFWEVMKVLRDEHSRKLGDREVCPAALQSAWCAGSEGMLKAQVLYAHVYPAPCQSLPAPKKWLVSSGMKQTGVGRD